MAITRNLDGQLAKLTLETLAAETIAGIAAGITHRLMLVVPKVMGQLGVQRAHNLPKAEATEGPKALL